MSILIDKNTKVICQGFTGKSRTFHSGTTIAYGTDEGRRHLAGQGGSLPRPAGLRQRPRGQGQDRRRSDPSSILPPPGATADAICEAIDAEIPLIICVTEGIPVLDMVRVKRSLVGSRSRLIGPRCPGVVTAGESKIGIMPANIFKPGSVGIVSRSGHADPGRRCSRPRARASARPRRSASAATRSRAPSSSTCSRCSWPTSTPSRS